MRLFYALSGIVMLAVTPCWTETQQTQDPATGEVKSAHAARADEDQRSTTNPDRKLIEQAVQRLIDLQHDDGAWPYEGVYRVGGKIPVGYRIGGTAIVSSALISSGVDTDGRIEKAVDRGVDLIIDELDHRLMKPSRTQRYDVRIWGHIYALDLFCRLHMTEGIGAIREKTDPLIAKLADALVFQEIDGGGWNYSNKRRHCCFVTAPAVQALLLARACDAKVPDEVLQRSLAVLEKTRTDKEIFAYSGTKSTYDTVAGSIARAPVSETTLLLLGGGNQKHLQKALDGFHRHWGELEKRRKQHGTHEPPHGIAPYYFYYGHRYAAQAIRMLPKQDQAAERAKFNKVLLRTKDEDNTWNDRVFEQSKAYGTAMSLLALSAESVLLPPAIDVENTTESSQADSDDE